MVSRSDISETCKTNINPMTTVDLAEAPSEHVIFPD